MKKTTLFVIKNYQKFISNFFLTYFFGNNNCRFYPSCSKYTYIAVSKYGTIKGLFLGFKRILHCHPFFKGGFDPVK